MRKLPILSLLLFALLLPLVAACGGTAQAPTSDEGGASTDATEEEPAADSAEDAAEDGTTEEDADAEGETAVDPDGSGLRLGLVTDIGRVNDGTFNEFAHEGALRAADDFGLEYRYIETQNRADYEQNINTLIDEEYDIIVSVGFLLADATYNAALDNPNIRFIGVDQSFTGERALPNLIGVQFREDQSGFMAGALAGMMTETNTVGFVGGVDVPAVKKFRNGYEHGVNYVNPDANVLGVYVPSFTDPAQGASVAQQFIGDGADIIFGAGGATGSGGITAAAEEGVYVIGVDQDEYNTTFGGGTSPGSDMLLTSAIKRVDVGVYDQVEAIANGTFEGNGDYILNAANEGITYADFHETADDIPEPVKERLEEIRMMLVEDELTTGVDPLSGDPIEAEIPESVPFEG